MQNIVFGPIHSRRFGISLGVDLSPRLKQCNFDCLYCELGGAKSVGEMHDVIGLDEVIDAINQEIKKSVLFDVLTITANGEPTLYPYLYELIMKIKQNQGQYKTLILSNGSLFGKKEVQKALKEFDIVKFSFDCFSPQYFRKLDRPFKELELEEIKKGIMEFGKIYQGELVAEILVVKNLNDSLEEMQKIACFLREMKIARVDLGTLDRPPAYGIQGVDFEVLLELSQAFCGLCVSIPTRNQQECKKRDLKDKDELLEIIARRPIAENEFLNLFAKNNLVFVQELLQEGKLCIKSVANMRFFALKS